MGNGSSKHATEGARIPLHHFIGADIVKASLYTVLTLKAVFTLSIILVLLDPPRNLTGVLLKIYCVLTTFCMVQVVSIYYDSNKPTFPSSVSS